MLPITYLFYLYLGYRIYQSGLITLAENTIHSGYEMVEYCSNKVVEFIDSGTLGDTVLCYVFYLLEILGLAEEEKEWVLCPRYYDD